jgi:voltage-gated sodium channel
MFTMVKRAVNCPAFNHFITSVILMQAAVLGLETFPKLNNYFYLFDLVNVTVLLIFIAEAILKVLSTYPHLSEYFRDGWNILDLSIIVLSILTVGSGYATVARLIRLLRVTRLTNRSHEMAAVVSTIIKSLPSMINIFLLLSLLFFIYGIAGYHLFHTVDSNHWGTLPKSIMTLFQILTLEGWVEIMSPVAAINPLNGIFFISFIIVGTFIVINIFVAVIVRKSEEAYKMIEGESNDSDAQKEILLEIKRLTKKIEDLEFKLSG